MTEQEKREKDIKEMIEIAFPTYRTELDVIAIQRLHDAGYRRVREIFAKCKEKSVREEGYRQGYNDGVKVTAEAIIRILIVEKGLRSNVVTDYQDRIDNVIKFIKKEFGVEVEE